MTDLHLEAARIIQKFNSKEGFIKNLVYSSTFRNLRQLFALVSETIKYQSILKEILKKSGSSLLTEELVNNNNELAIVLLYEELIGAGFGRAGHVRKMMRKHKAEIKVAHEAFLKENNATSLANVLSGNSLNRKDFPVLPRYARVNLIKCPVQEGIGKLCEDGWEYVGRLHVDRFKEDVSSLTEYQFGLDPLLDDVLVFPINTDLHKDKLVMDGTLVLQERASCVPAHVLNPQPGSVVLDCCAAPGNKTSHLASLMGDQGRVIALDRDAKRVSTMNSLLQRTGTTCVETFAQDFLTLSADSDEVSDITMILLDPSCSCTGMPTGTSYRQEVPLERLHALKRYQISLLKHALRFPNVQRVVYSTCSTSHQENEEVVEEVMYNVKHLFQFLPVLPSWPNSRGMKSFLHHSSFLRVSPEDHLSAGFFVACFERIKKAVKSDCENDISENVVDKSNESFVEVEKIETCSANESKVGQSCHYTTKKKKKKRHLSEDENETSCPESNCEEIKDRKKELDKEDDDADDVSENIRKRKKKAEEDEDFKDMAKRKKKKRNKKDEDVSEGANALSDNTPLPTEKKRKKKKHSKDVDEKLTENIEYENIVDNAEGRRKKKKKKKKEKDDGDETM